ncbi:MAG: HlyD family secretion protein [Tepidiphilus sp.]|jgi:multidrug efflux pump subunit AcrA (membrane-fusion protein)|nr:HlyD family secretion protein [Tepidiphilus sp.]
MKLNRARLRQYGLITGGLAVVMAFPWIALTQGPMAPVRVTVAPVARGDLQPAVFGIGTVEARHAYAIGPTQPGRLLAVHVDQGDVVKAGQVLAEMDPVDLDQRLAAADSARARAVYAVEMAAAQAREAASRAQLLLPPAAQGVDGQSPAGGEFELVERDRRRAFGWCRIEVPGGSNRCRVFLHGGAPSVWEPSLNCPALWAWASAF